MTDLRVPTATYRIQFSRNFTFKDSQDLVPYLYELGITDLYASPIFKARRGSLHGYSVTNPMEINPELGSRSSFDMGQTQRVMITEIFSAAHLVPFQKARVMEQRKRSFRKRQRTLSANRKRARQRVRQSALCCFERA
ncbi:MAG: alpha-amylase family glycosyl hydrolase [Syntrophobacteraceae bacterium]|jgi:hypothetical protein